MAAEQLRLQTQAEDFVAGSEGLDLAEQGGGTGGIEPVTTRLPLAEIVGGEFMGAHFNSAGFEGLTRIGHPATYEVTRYRMAS